MKVFLVLAMLLVAVQADMYLHNPPGCNDRNRERNDNRANGNRLFDSQNNGKGGYPWSGRADITQGPDALKYYAGSTLRLEWTNQHACGRNENDRCHVIIQAGYDTITGWDNKEALRAEGTASLKGARDGYPYGPLQASDNNNAGYQKASFTGEAGQNNQGTNTIPSNQYANDPVKREQFYTQGLLGGGEFGMHEHYDTYKLCTDTERNKGLYNADQKVNRNDMRGTRQNPNGGRRGLECPEERDYYPHWNPKIAGLWDDLYVLTNRKENCDYFRQNSQNVKPYGWCTGAGASKIPINAAACTASGGTWNTGISKGLPAPVCKIGMFGRDNHLGNAARQDGDGNFMADVHQPETAYELWTIPKRYIGKRLVLRFRYNISTFDYNSLPGLVYSDNGGDNGVGVDFSYNCPRITLVDTGDVDALDQDVEGDPCTNLITSNRRPMYNRPYVHVFQGLGKNQRLSIAINTHQSGRTFQDRTYMMEVVAPPSYIPDEAKIWNLNSRGRRGNIVQCYPAVEYDFVPSVLQVDKRDYIHVQFHGSDFNAAKNANNGEGWQYSSRTNLCEMENAGFNFPAFYASRSLFSETVAQRWALVGQDAADCEEYENGQANEQNSITNCGKLNRMSARFPLVAEQGLMQVGADIGTYDYVSTRNNNFSNRSHKGKFVIAGAEELTASEIAGIVIGSAVFAGACVMAVCFYGYKRKNTVAGRWYAKSSQRCAPICGPVCGRCTGFCATSAQHEGFKQQKSGTMMTSGSTRPKMTAPPDLEHTRY